MPVQKSYCFLIGLYKSSLFFFWLILLIVYQFDLTFQTTSVLFHLSFVIFCFNFITLILVIFFSSAGYGMGVVCSCFSSFWRYDPKLSICALSDFLMYAFNAMNFPLSTTFSLSERF